MDRKDKIQHLLISHLMEEGTICLNLPDEMVIEIGIVKEGRKGILEKNPDYCWIIVSQKDREASIDAFNLGLKFPNTKDKVIIEDDVGEMNPIRHLNVI